MKANETEGEKDWRQLHKNTACIIVQDLDAALHKTPAVLPPTTHHEPDMQDTAGEVKTSLKGCTPVDPFTLTSKDRTTSSNQHTAVLCRYEMLSDLLQETMDDWEGWRERVRVIHADRTTWWYVIRGWIFQNCPERFRTFYRLSLGFASMSNGCF